jgi:predicted DNA-binding protein
MKVDLLINRCVIKVRKTTMSTIMIDLPTETYKRLQYQARRAGKPPEIFMRDVLESALQVSEQASPTTTREVLAAMGRIRLLSPTLRRKIIPGVTLEEVRAALTRANDPPLSELILEQRGKKE